MTRFVDVVATAEAVGATRSRNEKKAALAALLGRLEPDEVRPVIGFLTGELRQGRIGVGWASVRDLEVAPAPAPTLTVGDVDRTVSELAATVGPGSQQRRHELLTVLYARATGPESEVLGRLFIGELRTGALAGVVTDALAAAAGIALAVVRRAVMLAGDLGEVAHLALASGDAEAGERAVRAVGLRPMRPVQPMLASTSASVAEAIAEIGESSVEWKLDGARVQVHREGDDVAVFTRNLNDVTARLPEVVELVRSFDAGSVVLDGEVLGYTGPDDDPHAFQDTMSRFGRDDASSHPTRLVARFFDLLHLDGVDLIDEPLRSRRARLVALAGDHVVPGVITDDPDAAATVLDDALGRGHEGVMVKASGSAYEAGRRGKSWRKVKPVHTLDLVVLAVEWGHGRRAGTLSNLHLGARNPDNDAGDEFVMVGKTFKGMTDEMLTWQTERFQQLKVGETEGTVWVRPEQVVEVALDGAQVSTRYPGGVALRFARVVRHRDDKVAADADTLGAVRALLPGARRDPKEPDIPP